MKAYFLAVSMFLMGCELPPGTGEIESHHYYNACLKNIYSEMGGLVQQNIDYNVKVAQMVMVGRIKGLDSDQQFCDAFGGVQIDILDETLWHKDTLGDRTKCNAGETCYEGFYSVFDGIALNKNIRSLAHELLHHWDMIHLGILTGNHSGWDKNGYNEVNDEYNSQKKFIDSLGYCDVPGNVCN